MGLLGKPTILGNPQLVEYDARSLWNFWASTTSWMLRMCKYLKIGISPLLYWNVKDLPSLQRRVHCLRIIWDWSATLLLLPGNNWFGCQPPAGKPLTSSKRRHPADLSLADRGAFECRNLGTLSSCLHRSGYRDLEEVLTVKNWLPFLP